MKAVSLFLFGMLAGAGGMALLHHVPRRSEPTQPAATAAVRATQPQDDSAQAPAATRADSAAVIGGEPPSVATEHVAREPLEPGTGSEWNALVGGMLEWQVEHRTGERLSARKRDRLVSELARLRQASLAQQEAPADPGDPAELRERLARTLTIAQVDAAFREELGIGVGEFVRQMDPDAVQNVPRPAQH